MSVVAYPPAQEVNSDEQLANRISNLLRGQFRASASRLSVAANSGVVTLRGVANSYYQKQLWLHATWQDPEVDRIDDQIRVEPIWD
jgi:osmotically-inducible protein OsmY